MKKEPLEYVIYRGTKIYPGHPCKVAPSAKGKHDGYDTIVRTLWGYPERRAIEVDVVEDYNGALRTYPVTRIVPYLRNVEKIRTRIIEDRRKRLGLRDDEGSSGAKKRGPTPKKRR